MSGNDNSVTFARAIRIEPSNAQDAFIVQRSFNNIGLINNSGNPEGVVNGNPASLCFDRSSGNVYRKTAGTGNTGWVLIGSGGGAETTFNCDVGSCITSGNVLAVTASGGITTSGALNTLTVVAGPTIPTSFNSDGGPAIPAGGALTLAGGVGLTSSGAGSTITFDLDIPVAVIHGGTEQVTLTDGGIMLGSGIGPVTVTAQPTDGQLLIGFTGADPVLANLTSLNSTISIANGSGIVDLTVGSNIAFNYVTDDTNFAVPALNVLNILGAGTVTTSSLGNTVTITGVPTTFPWISVIALTQQLAVNTGYIGDNTSLPVPANITYTLPLNAAFGDIIEITNFGGDLPRIEQNVGQNIAFTASLTTNGVAGSLTAIEQFSSVRMVCAIQDTLWIVLSHTGNWTVV